MLKKVLCWIAPLKLYLATMTGDQDDILSLINGYLSLQSFPNILSMMRLQALPCHNRDNKMGRVFTFLLLVLAMSLVAASCTSEGSERGISEDSILAFNSNFFL